MTLDQQYREAREATKAAEREVIEAAMDLRRVFEQRISGRLIDACYALEEAEVREAYLSRDVWRQSEGWAPDETRRATWEASHDSA